MSKTTIITVADVRALLAPLNLAQLERLSKLSGVSRHTIYKIRQGHTSDPGLDTVGKFLPHIREAKRPTPVGVW